MKKINLILVSLIFIIGLGSCKRNPTDRLVDPNLGGSVPNQSGVFFVFDDELKTGGGLGLIPRGENQALSLTDQSSPRSGLAQVQYSWNGLDVVNEQAVPPVAQHLFAGISFLITPDFIDFPSATPRDLSSFGYTRMIFSIRGSLSANTTLKVEGPDDGSTTTIASNVFLTSGQVGSTWNEITLPIMASEFASVKSFATFTFIYTQPPRTTIPGNGGVIYLDNIRYE